MKIHEIEQQSPEWFNVRKLKATASHATAIGNCGKGLDTYVLEIVAEYLSSADKEQFSNKHTDRGNELEPQARTIYELTTGKDVKQVGFIEHNDYFGCSPDGLIDDDGGLEIKCIDDVGYLKMLLGEEISSDYQWQIQMNLLITGRKWWDFVAYNPNFKQSIIIKRVVPDKDKQEKLSNGFILAENKIKEILNKLN